MIHAPMNAAVCQINRLFVEGTVSGLSDGQLLERFLDGRDEAAFTALVERHGPMVFRTCQAVIRDHGAAEDAFQATFLVLVCKARTIRGRQAIGGWLHRVAYRIAIQASADAARQRGRERLVSDLVVEDQSRDDSSVEWRQIVHDEVARLSDKYRLPVLLCDLEGKTHSQAASELKWGEATVRRRLAGAHDLLRSRLGRRGVGLTVAGLAAALGRSADAEISATCIQTTVRAAAQMSTTAMRIAIGEVVSTTAAALVRSSLRTMLLGELKTIMSVTTVLGFLGSLAWGVALFGPAERHAAVAIPKPRDVPASVPAQANANRPNDVTELFTYEGRVVDPAEQPIQSAALYLNSYRLKQPKNLPVRAITGPDGRFRFAVSRSDFDTPEKDDPWPPSTIVARARGYAFAVEQVRGDAKELTLQLVRDDVPIAGRIIDLEGRPVAEATVKVLEVRAMAKGSLDDWLKALDERKELHELDHEFLPYRLEGRAVPSIIPSVATGADGRLRIDGIGRERVATLQVEGPTIETKQFQVRTRAGTTIRVPVYKGSADLVTSTAPASTMPPDRRRRSKELFAIRIPGSLWPASWSAASTAWEIRSSTSRQSRMHKATIGCSVFPAAKRATSWPLPPCDFPISGPMKADLKVPRDEELPYLPTIETVAKTEGTGPLHLDIKLKRGVWVTGRIIDKATGKPVRAQITYFVYLDNPALKASYSARLPMDTYHFTSRDGTFQRVAFPGAGVLAARASEDFYVFGAGVDSFKHKPENGFLSTNPHYAVPTNYHVLAEIDPAEGTRTLSCDLLLETGRSLTVTALGPDGKPLTDMKIAGLKDMAYWETPPAQASTHTIHNLTAGKGPRTLTFLQREEVAGRPTGASRR